MLACGARLPRGTSSHSTTTSHSKRESPIARSETARGRLLTCTIASARMSTVSGRLITSRQTRTCCARGYERRALPRPSSTSASSRTGCLTLVASDPSVRSGFTVSRMLTACCSWSPSADTTSVWWKIRMAYVSFRIVGSRSLPQTANAPFHRTK